MTAQPHLPTSLHPSPLSKRLAQGAGLAFVLIALFMAVFASGANLKFGLWAILPLLTVPVAGAFGGLLYFLLDYLRCQGSWQKVVANVFWALAYCAGLWISLVAAFAVTGLWD
ncbi:potassium transporter KefB [Hymenobacter busanensis]|uniref:Potassium transporter KefB n=1 Tax=Hymenobacter busanensis TaxID=2607656 RepID=A0A7L4ZT55_9BACT|nr:potassium transporter KefB [Hymenobacter busanensis]KAA9327535.1 potassium transporter KefB [Hymenobacter busanensis]QHJ06127.1 potassium transporter KefB [Hymenobacter busanensis]